ncbi:MAG: transcriptional repressor [Anaerolineales bacterium]|nr:MAG: transcriptional repressor [Anaerolineales bacterium]
MQDGTDLQQAYRATGRRLTRQRRLVLKALEEADGHLDAEALHDRARVYDHDISLATVYRTLAALKEVGLVEEHRLGEGHSHYEPVRAKPHYHFTCVECGNVIEFDTPLVARIMRWISRREGVSIASAHLHLTGYCANCARGQEGRDNDEA